VDGETISHRQSWPVQDCSIWIQQQYCTHVRLHQITPHMRWVEWCRRIKNNATKLGRDCIPDGTLPLVLQNLLLIPQRPSCWTADRPCHRDIRSRMMVTLLSSYAACGFESIVNTSRYQIADGASAGNQTPNVGTALSSE